MTRPPRSEAAEARLNTFHTEIIHSLAELIGSNDVVVVGMGWNPHVRRARAALDAAGVAHHDVDYGNYASAWKPRLAIKMWTGWPTFPQVFHKGVLVGGADETQAAIDAGAFKA